MTALTSEIGLALFWLLGIKDAQRVVNASHEEIPLEEASREETQEASQGAKSEAR